MDRSKFKATSMAASKAADKKINEQMLGSNEKAGKLKIEDGKNLFRIYPPHTDELGGGTTFFEPTVKVFVPAWVPERDDKGKEILENGKAKLKLSVKPVFNARVHGGYKKDLIEEYVRVGKDLAETLYANDKKSKDRFLNILLGKYSPKKEDNLPGLSYKTNYAIYAAKIVGDVQTFGELEFSYAVKKGLNDAAAAAEDGDDAMAVDPFTDLDDGKAVLITYDKATNNPSEKYKVAMDAVEEKSGPRKGMLRKFPVTDEQFENYVKFPPLKKLYHNVFKESDFKIQLDGLQIFDKKYQLGIFDTDEFGLAAEEVAGYFSKDSEPSNEEVDEALNQNDNDESNDNEENDTDQFTLMSRLELINFNKENKVGVKIAPTMKEDEIRTLIRNKYAAIPHIPLPGDADYVEPKQEKKETTSERIARMSANKKQ